MKRRIVGSLLVWLAAVATVAAIATIAIGTAGRQVTSQLLATPSPIAVPASVRSTPVTEGGSSEATTGPVDAESGAGTAGPGVQAAPRLVVQAVRADGGHVQARCTGRRVVGYALPDDGWRARISSTAHRRLEVVFSFGSSRAVLVTAVCEQGEPAFRQTTLDPRGPVAPTSGPAVEEPSARPTPGVTDISPSATVTGKPSAPTNTAGPTPSGTSAAPTTVPDTTSSTPPDSAAPSSSTTPPSGDSEDGASSAIPATPAAPSATRVAQELPSVSRSSSDEASDSAVAEDPPPAECLEGAAAVPEAEDECVAGGTDEESGVTREM